MLLDGDSFSRDELKQLLLNFFNLKDDETFIFDNALDDFYERDYGNGSLRVLDGFIEYGSAAAPYHHDSFFYVDLYGDSYKKTFIVQNGTILLNNVQKLILEYAGIKLLEKDDEFVLMAEHQEDIVITTVTKTSGSTLSIMSVGVREEISPDITTEKLISLLSPISLNEEPLTVDGFIRHLLEKELNLVNEITQEINADEGAKINIVLGNIAEQTDLLHRRSRV